LLFSERLTQNRRSKKNWKLSKKIKKWFVPSCYKSNARNAKKIIEMKVLVDIRNEAKVPFVMEFLSSQSYIKAQPMSDAAAKLMQDLKEAMNEVKLHRQGKLKLKTAEQLLNQL
jgi:predicted deacetylase